MKNHNDLKEIIGIGRYRDLLFDKARRKFVYNLLYVIFFDKIYGTNFGIGGRLKQGQIGTTKERANDYSATPRHIIHTLKQLKLNKNETIIDLGCGKGLAMYYMGKFPFKKIAGIELSRLLCESAIRNLKKLKIKNRSRYKFIHGDAGHYDQYADYTIFYIYNSFPKNVMREVMKQIENSLESRPRRVIILYLFPEFPNEVVRNRKFILLKCDGKNEIRKGMHIFVDKEHSKEDIFKK